MNPLGWLPATAWAALAAVVLLLVLAGRRRPWEGATPAQWWRDQRTHRRPAAIWRRLGRVLATAALLVLAASLAAGAVLVLAAGVLLAVLLAAGWYAATRAAIRTEPTSTPLEDGRAGFMAEFGDAPFDRQVIDGDVGLAPDPDTPYPGSQNYRAEIDI